MSRLLAAFSLAAAIAAVPTLVRGEAEVQPTPFYTTLMTNWQAWDVDHDQTLSKDEINRAASDPSVVGDAAAAASALKQCARNAKLKLPSLTKAYFEQYSREAALTAGKESAKEAENATVDPGISDESKQAEAKGPATNWDRYFLASKARIAAGGGGDIWRKQVNAASMKQGPLGDCFFVACLGSMAIHDAPRVQTLVSPAGEGHFVAHFPNAEPFTFAAPTQALLAASGTTAEDGAWLAVMEQAYGKLRSKLKGGSLDIDGTEVLRTGGDSIPTIENLTGHKAKRISFGTTIEDRAAKGATVLPELRKMLVESMAKGRVAVCGGCQDMKSAAGNGPTTQPTLVPVAALGKVPKAINKNHVYAVVSYDPATDVVEIWNPHRNNFTPAGPDGLLNGYTTKDGRFKLPLTEAQMFYGSFTFETDKPVDVK